MDKKTFYGRWYIDQWSKRKNGQIPARLGNSLIIGDTSMSSANKDNPILDGLRKEFSQEIPENPYEEYFLSSNPFPTLRQFYGICVDQEAVKSRFTQILRDFYLNSQTQIMTMLGSTGAGKTNLLRFLEQTLRSWREPNAEKKAITDLYTVFVEQPQGSYLEIHRQIISQLSTMFFTEFFSVVRQRKIDLSKLPAQLSGTNPELIRALVHITRREFGQLSLPDLSGHEPQSYRTLENWLQGVKLTAEEKKQLGNISVEIGKSSTVAIKFLSDLVKIFLHVEIFKGVIIFLDEFEEIFSGLTSTSQAQYAQDLRNLFDSHPEGIVFVIATAPIAEQLQQISPALQRRLGPGVQIAPISDENAALEYAREYIKWGRGRFEDKTNSKICLLKHCQEADTPYYPLTEAQVKEVYNKLKSRYGAENVIPGSLLPELNLLLYQLVYQEK